MSRLPRRRALFEWVLAIVILAVILAKGDPGELRRLLRADPLQLLLGLACTFLIAAAATGKWRLLVSGVAGERTPSWRVTLYYFFLARLAGLVTPIAVSDAGVRALALRTGHRISLTRAGYSIFVDRGLDLAATLVAAAPSLLYLAGALDRGSAVAATLLVLAGAALLLWWKPGAFFRALGAMYALALRMVRRASFLLPAALRGRELTPPREAPVSRAQAAYLFGMSVAGLFGLGVRFHFILRAVDVAVDPVALLLCIPAAQLVTLLAFTPGGLGILEAGWYGIFALLGVPPPQIVLALVSSRAFVVLFILISYAATWVWTRSERMEPGVAAK